MCKCNVCAFLYPASDPDMEEIFDRIVKILYEHDRTLCYYMLKDVNINAQTEEDIVQEFMNKVTAGFKEDYGNV